MKQIKSIISVIAVLAICAGMISGCGNVENTSTDEAFNMTWWCKNNTSGAVKSYNDVKGLQLAAQNNDMTIEFIHPVVGQESEQFNVMIASGDYPDVIEYNWQSYPGGEIKAVSDNVLVSLDSYVNKKTMPNLWAWFEDAEVRRKNLKSCDGTINYLPGVNDTITTNYFMGPIIRQDWLDKLGLEMPETIDDWYTVLKAFKEQDPNGNGVADEIPLTDQSGRVIRLFAAAWGTSEGMQLTPDGKSVVYGPAQPAHKEWIKTMRQWYVEGLLDNEFISQNRQGVDHKMTADIAGAFVGFTGSQMGAYISARENDGTGYLLAGTPWAKLDENSPAYIAPTTASSGRTGLGITSDNKDIDKTIKFFDYMYSDEAALLKSFGVEGESYEKVDGGYKFLDSVLYPAGGKDAVTAIGAYALPIYAMAGTVTMMDAYNQVSRSFDEQAAANAVWGQGDNALIMPPLAFTEEESAVIADSLADISVRYNEFVTNVLLGAESIDAWDEYIKDIKGMGLDDVEAAYQAAYDRYLSY